MPQDYDDKIDKKIEEFRAQEEEALASVLASTRYNIPYVDLSATTISNEALRLVTEDEARRLMVAPFKIFGKEAHIAVLSPDSEDLKAYLEDVKRKGYEPIVYMASHASLQRAWARYKEISFAEASKHGGLEVSSKTLTELQEQITRFKPGDKSTITKSI